MQKSPWDSDYLSRLADFDDLRSQRSTSAPPPETSFLFGRQEGLGTPAASYFGGRDFALEEKWHNNSRLHAPFPAGTHDLGGTNSLFLNSSNLHNGASIPASYDKPPPGFGTDRLSSSLRDASQMSGIIDRRAIGENLGRSQSAAPSLDGKLSMGPPPGLATSETPLVSNRTARDSYLESSMHTSRVFQLGQRRPASTGVIGGTSVNSSSSVLHSLGLGSDGGGGGAVRPSAKTLMDLIQEDFPPESSLIDMHGFREEIYVERPRTTSPLSLQTRDFRYEEAEDRRESGGGVLSDAFDRLRIHHQDEYRLHDRQGKGHQIAHEDRVGIRQSHDARSQTSIYAQTPPVVRPQPQLHQQHVSFEQNQQQPQVYGVQPHIQYVQTHVLPTGQTIYLNVPSPQQYGHQPVHYQQILQQVPAGMGPNGEQFISIMPMAQGGPAPTANYSYFATDGQSPVGPTYVITPHQQQLETMRPTASPNRGQGAIDSQRPAQTGGRGTKEKAGRGKRGNVRREPKSPPVAVSPLLETFKAKKNRNWTLLDITGHVIDFCLDQNGSRFIQQRLEVGSAAEKEAVMLEVLPSVRRLRNDVFGNYVVQKLFDVGSPKTKAELLETLHGEMLQLSLQMYGCRVVQKALEALDDSDVQKLLCEFHHNVLSCIHDQNGNHVIQKCIEVTSAKATKAQLSGDESAAKFFEGQIDFIVDDVLNNVRSLSCHPYGCRVLQRILEHCPEPKKSRALDEIKKYHKALLDDQFGNYVIQHVLQYGRSTDRDSLLDIIVSSGLLILARQKFASNVVEKLLKYGNTDQRSRVVEEMMKTADQRTGATVPEAVEGTTVVVLMVRDAFANYVVQTTLDVVADPAEKYKLMEELSTHSTELKNYTFAKHIVNKLESWSSRAITP